MLSWRHCIDNDQRQSTLFMSMLNRYRERRRGWRRQWFEKKINGKGETPTGCWRRSNGYTCCKTGTPRSRILWLASSHIYLNGLQLSRVEKLEAWDQIRISNRFKVIFFFKDQVFLHRQCRCRIRKLYSHSSEKLCNTHILHHIHRTKANKQVTTFTVLASKHSLVFTCLALLLS